MVAKNKLYNGVKIDFNKVNNRCFCRGDCGESYTHRKLNYGETVLRIKTYGASGWQTSLYCKKCMLAILDLFRKCLDEYSDI